MEWMCYIHSTINQPGDRLRSAAISHDVSHPISRFQQEHGRNQRVVHIHLPTFPAALDCRTSELHIGETEPCLHSTSSFVSPCVP
ncbi:hypothetical protein CB0940_10743 [Cercospora beticola]|uniref:Uncharacterized protein n=1 Tax=Cercospora beticola TaxID=122368 RepID=A0A2G5HUU5_CERBT|nr:hypothetical protein CB0940_10743 [Cercospora beticola]PIA96012.1 hypothetical protein CB0940_10743 [Cercospora beticola]